MDNETLLKIHKAIASPTHMQRYETAKLLIANEGEVPRMTHRSRIRTFYRIRKVLKENGLI